MDSRADARKMRDAVGNRARRTGCADGQNRRTAPRIPRARRLHACRDTRDYRGFGAFHIEASGYVGAVAQLMKKLADSRVVDISR